MSSIKPSEGAGADLVSNLKQQAGYKAIDDHVTSGMVVGLGTGSTAYFAVERLGQKLKSGELFDILAISTSNRTEEQAKSLGIPLTTLNCHSVVDITIDGADAADSESFGLVKGGGGALLREKLVEAAARKFVVIVDESKVVQGLGTSFAVPVEIVQFAHEHISRQIQALPGVRGCQPKLRRVRIETEAGTDDGDPYVTDNGNFILDLHFDEPILNPTVAARDIASVVGVVEHGLFLGMASEIIVAGTEGIRVLTPPTTSLT